MSETYGFRCKTCQKDSVSIRINDDDLAKLYAAREDIARVLHIDIDIQIMWGHDHHESYELFRFLVHHRDHSLTSLMSDWKEEPIKRKGSESLLKAVPISFADWDGDQPVLIFHDAQGEEWENQAGGVACSHPKVCGRGYLLPFFTGDCLCCMRDGYDDMQKRLDRARLPVLIKGGEEANLDVDIRIGDTVHSGTIFYNNCD